MNLKEYLQIVEVRLFETYCICALMMVLSTLAFKNIGTNYLFCIGVNILLGLFGVFFTNPIATILNPCSGRLRLRNSMFDEEST
jgi:hypothetical protein